LVQKPQWRLQNSEGEGGMMYSGLERKLSEDRFVVTAEIGPPMSASGDDVLRIIEKVKGCADAYNVTDNQTATVRLSSLAGSVFCLREGLEPIMQIVCRDRNRIAMQSDVLGASALGVRNILCLSGDHQSLGSQPDAKNVFDVDSTQELMMFRKMRDESKLWSGDDLKVAPKLFLGAVTNPFGDPKDLHTIRLMNKSAAGAQFVQTQPVFDADAFEEWIGDVVKKGIHKRTRIIAGILPMKSHRAARRLAHEVPGMFVTDDIVKRMSSAADEENEGLKIAAETIEAVRGMKGVSGIHIMPVFWYSAVRRLVDMAGVTP
jgi:methylenetetrahydrofolate reductase (NADPH)